MVDVLAPDWPATPNAGTALPTLRITGWS